MLNVIVYGLGDEFDKVKTHIEEKYHVLAYSDKKLKINIEKFVIPEKLVDLNADLIIVCSHLYFMEIKFQLKTQYKLTNIPIVGFEELHILRDKKSDIYIKQCVCCGGFIQYEPLPDYYQRMQKNTLKVIPEFINKEEYSCPQCGATDRARLIISFLRICGMENYYVEKRLLHIGPESSLEYWISEHCPNILQETTDLYKGNVTFRSDIQDMHAINPEYYDIFICSHVLEHVENDKKAMRELFRILKKSGIGIFLVPICLNYKQIDEEWGLSEEENWKRFGQGDHCRRYARDPLIKRLEEAGFFVHRLGKAFFGEYLFWQNALIDESVLYILTKNKKDIKQVINELKLRGKWNEFD